MRAGWIAGLALAGTVVAGATWWSKPPREAAGPPSRAVSEAALTETNAAEPPATQQEPVIHEYLAERPAVAPPAQAVVAAPSVPVPPPAHVTALRESMKNGDPRTPPLVRSDNLREMPTDQELADPGLYQQYEQRQTRKVYASFVSAANSKITELQALIKRGEETGLSQAQLEEGRRKLEGLQNQRNELLAAHPELQDEGGQE